MWKKNREVRKQSNAFMRCTLSLSFVWRSVICVPSILYRDSYYPFADTHALPEIDLVTKGQPTLHMSAAPFLVTVTRNLTRDYDCGAWRPSIFVRGRFTTYTLLSVCQF